MGMFDSMYDAEGNEWQTKAFVNLLERWELGDEMPYIGTATYQVEVLGGPVEFDEAIATIRDGRLASIGDQRDESLPLLDYYGDWIVKEGS